MVALLQNALGPSADAVIEGGDGVQQHHGCAVDTDAGDGLRVRVQAGIDDQPGGTCERKQDADQMRPGIETFSVIHGSPMGKSCWRRAGQITASASVSP